MRPERTVAILLTGLLAAGLLAFGVINILRVRNPEFSPSGGYNSYGRGMMGGYPRTRMDYDAASEEALQADAADALKNAVVDEANNTITYSGSAIRIVLFGGLEEADEKFVVGGLVNPTLHVPVGARVTIVLANADEHMPHAFEITGAEPPYRYMAMMSSGWIYPGSFIPTLPQSAPDLLPTAETTFTADEPGAFHYICQYPGHAQEGMYGQIFIG